MKRVRAAAGGLARSNVSVVYVGLQVSLREIGAFTSLNNTTHVERATQALFNPLHRICTAVHVETEERNRRSDFSNVDII